MCDKVLSPKRLSWGEFFDRYTILSRKASFDIDAFGKELLDFFMLIDSDIISADILNLVCLLMMKNTDIWNLESAIRKGEEGALGLVEVGKRAIKIREINDERIKLVNEINKRLGGEFKDKKI